MSKLTANDRGRVDGIRARLAQGRPSVPVWEREAVVELLAMLERSGALPVTCPTCQGTGVVDA